MAGKVFSKLKEFFKPSADLKAGKWSVGKDRHVVYSPFAVPLNPKVRKLGTSWEPHDKYIVVRHGDMPEALGFVKDSQTVFIVCHCSALAKDVEDNAGNKLTAEELAERIAADGLSKRHRRVKLYACSGGTGGLDSFASQLAGELILQGYFSLELYAYVSTVCSLDPDTGQKSALDLDQKGEPVQGTRVRPRNMRVRVL